MKFLRSPITTKRWLLATVICTVLVVSLTGYHINYIGSLSPIVRPFQFLGGQKPALLIEQGRFWTRFAADLRAHRPATSPLDHENDDRLRIAYNASRDQERPDNLTVSADQHDALRSSHQAFVQALRVRSYHPPYQPGSRGVVTTAGGPYLPIALVSIRMLREAGSMLPVEVFLASREEYDAFICDEVLPGLNARCLLLQDIFEYDRSSRGSRSDLKHYQFKIMSILFSSFEQVLFLDSDCFPLDNPDFLFDHRPFTETGLVLWPDFWYPSESPSFFSIAAVPMPALRARAAIESGEMLFDKSRHESSLLLAAYYNFYGPEFYYPLQSQGAPGEGDKETFFWSAAALNASIATVHHPVSALGYRTRDGGWRGSAMAQFDPVAEVESASTSRAQRPLFLHANFPKLDPGSIFDDSSFGATGPTRDSDSTQRRIWFDSATDALAFFGTEFDVEERVWTVELDLACTYEGKIKAWSQKEGVCAKAKEYVQAVWPQILHDRPKIEGG